jgi:hypothetical protein
MTNYATVLALAAMLASPAFGAVLISLDDPNQTGSPGDTLVFTGVLSNGDPDTVFLNSDSLNLVGSSFLINDLFFSSVPVSLDAGQSSQDFDLFEITVFNPFTDPPGLFMGSYGIIGGSNSDAQVLLGSASFSITEVSSVAQTPEPSSLFLFAIGLTVLRRSHQRRFRSAH